MIEQVLTFLVGVGLAASVGLRISFPILIVSIFSYSGYITLSTYFVWLGTLPALIVLIIIATIDTLAFYIVWLDNLLDAIEHPVSILVGILITGAVITEFNPYLKWLMALIIGGGIAGTINAATGLLRLKISTETDGKRNFAFSTLEILGSIGLAIISIFLPFIAGLISAIALIYFSFVIKKKFLSPSKDDD
jgi:hypothetical protein